MNVRVGIGDGAEGLVIEVGFDLPAPWGCRVIRLDIDGDRPVVRVTMEGAGQGGGVDFLAQTQAQQQRLVTFLTDRLCQPDQGCP